jgi:hypothetical protein
MADGDGGGSEQLEPRKTEGGGKKKISPLRNVIGVVLLVTFATVAVLEFQANRGYNAAMNALVAKMPSDEDADAGLLPMVEAEKLIGKPADGPAVKEANLLKKTYTWRGAVRTHKLVAFYSVGDPSGLVRIGND